MELLESIHGWLSSLPPGGVYLALFIIAYVENVVPPIPGDVAIVVAGMVAAAGAVSLPVLVALAAVAGALGFMSVYAVGKRLDAALLDPGRFRWLPKDDIRKAEGYVARYGYFVVAANRFMPGVRAVIGLSVGMSGLAPGRVAALATLSAAVWAALMGALGYALVDNREVLARLLGGVERVGTVLMALLAVGLAAWLIRTVRRRRGARSGADQETEKSP
ncbi:MAG TPA: VTT domain-containing protein [Rhodothermales bacterium]|nr:VTT domain-containing protein [Rhodothermales bacterium]